MKRLIHRTSAVLACVVLSVFSGVVGCGGPVDGPSDHPHAVGTKKHALFPLTSRLWASTSVPVCWETLDWAADRAEVRRWIADAYQATPFRFTGWGACASNSSGIRLQIADDPALRSCTSTASCNTNETCMSNRCYRQCTTDTDCLNNSGNNSGMNCDVGDGVCRAWPRVRAFGSDLNGVPNGVVLNFQFNTFQEGRAPSAAERLNWIRWIAAHEFGHAIGLSHEQNRNDTPSSCTQGIGGVDFDNQAVGDWDVDSIMNYCNPSWNNLGLLSVGDVTGINQVYGRARLILPGTRYFPGDFNGDGIQDLLAVSPDGQWIGVLSRFPGRSDMHIITLSYNWVNHPSTTTDVGGWKLGSYDKILVGKFHGGTTDEIFISAGSWRGLLALRNGRLACTWIGEGWVNHPGGSGANGWNFNSDNQMVVGRFTDNNADQIFVSAGTWHGILSKHGDGLAAGWIGEGWVNHPGGSGANGWNFNSANKMVIGDFLGNGYQQIFISSGPWYGLLSKYNDKLACTWIGVGWVNHPGTSGANGWNFNSEHRMVVGRFTQSNVDQIFISAGTWHGILSKHGDGLAAGWIGNGWVNRIGSSGADGWDFNSSHAMIVGDFIGNGYQQIFISSGSSYALLSKHNDKLAHIWGGQDWVNHHGTSGANGWNFHSSHTMVSGRFLDSSPAQVFISSGHWHGLLTRYENGLAAGWIGFSQ